MVEDDLGAGAASDRNLPITNICSEASADNDAGLKGAMKRPHSPDPAPPSCKTTRSVLPKPTFLQDALLLQGCAMATGADRDDRESIYNPRLANRGVPRPAFHKNTRKIQGEEHKTAKAA